MRAGYNSQKDNFPIRFVKLARPPWGKRTWSLSRWHPDCSIPGGFPISFGFVSCFTPPTTYPPLSSEIQRELKTLFFPPLRIPVSLRTGRRQSQKYRICNFNRCLCGGTGRRAGLKIQYLHGCGSSILPGGTNA
jgi:hypothetical protein